MKLPDVQQEYETLRTELESAALVSHAEKYKELGPRLAKLEKIIKEAHAVTHAEKEVKELEELAAAPDSDIATMAEDELPRKRTEMEKHRKTLAGLLNPSPDEDISKIILEIRAGAGGQEAALFASELFTMYKNFAATKGWSFNLIDASQTDIGGYKEVVAEIEGDGVYQKLKYESGVHRVQRVPDTEKIGRIHTSTISVAVLPEAKDVDIEVRPEDVKVEFFRSSGPGGQNVNKVETAVRLIHVPTGVIVTCQEGRSQQKNREKAMTILKTRLVDARRQAEEKKMSAERKAQIGTADRSEKIRTYNFPQDRITDHRIHQSFHNIHSILEGNLNEVIDLLVYDTDAVKS